MQSIKEIMQQRGMSIISGNHANQEQVQVPTTSSTSEDDTQRREVMNRLFLKFAAFYGNNWRNTYKTPGFLEYAKNEWQKALEGYSENQLFQALTQCVKHHTFPPNLAEFFECLKFVTRKDDFSKREPLPPCSPEIAELNIKKIRSLLNIKPRQPETKTC